ncbi:MAG: hypothetical protein COU69_01570 [Candidatus Pacebacteria bacterium CG10_big_fil_rev_8_21_14_0_10_56_10]|nr:MAG: hypothetical protein COU69_01570 [Candidatus Pacebacteria bacterium CG10_big_fil_rev_8_21_14_0_10_56_10]
MKNFQSSTSRSAPTFSGLLIGVVLLAAVLRLYQLGRVPAGMTWDEAAIAYNGFSVVTTYRDEWLERLPISFRSFGDYKAPLAIYLNGAVTRVLGLELWAVRLPFALAGVAAVALMGVILRRLAVDDPALSSHSLVQPDSLALVGALLLAVSPWHHHFSRAGFESGLALTLLLASVWGWLKATDDHRTYWGVLGWLTVSALSASLAMYAYHSAKIVVPLLGLALGWWWRSWVKHHPKQVLAAAGLGAVSLLPLLHDAVVKEGIARLSQTSIFTPELSFAQLVLTAAGNFTSHLTPAFLVFGQTTTLRHGDGRWGVLLVTTLLLVVAALLGLVWHWRQGKGIPRTLGLGLVWVGVSLLPAAIGLEVPHSNRTLLGLPGVILLAVAGLPLVERLSRRVATQLDWTPHRTKLAGLSVLGMMLLLHSLLTLSYLHDYYTRFAAESAAAFQEGYLEAFEYVLPFETGQRGSDITKIVFSSSYGQPYIYALLARESSPYQYHAGDLIKYEFADVDIDDLSRRQAIVVAAGSDNLPISEADHLILGSDSSVRFAIFILE